MFDLGKVIGHGAFTNRICLNGELTLHEHGISAECFDIKKEWHDQLKFEGFTSFRVHHSRKGFFVNRHYYRVDDPEAWIEAIKEALTVKGIKFKKAETYRVVE